ncbi:hypothetical protein IE53DRAFT_210964 [Violaceomyces palustris]|uniref:Uncharacterized protein n=1 Tax=Violaceomyces palustris TaxID=1673888 RepID=A0ACD0P4Q6_9BASI|nr:hypothetical protein IE53DRAFT_210964 [Violaceomyces palustris]
MKSLLNIPYVLLLLNLTVSVYGGGFFKKGPSLECYKELSGGEKKSGLHFHFPSFGSSNRSASPSSRGSSSSTGSGSSRGTESESVAEGFLSSHREWGGEKAEHSPRDSKTFYGRFRSKLQPLTSKGGRQVSVTSPNNLGQTPNPDGTIEPSDEMKGKLTLIHGGTDLKELLKQARKNPIPSLRESHLHPSEWDGPKGDWYSQLLSHAASSNPRGIAVRHDLGDGQRRFYYLPSPKFE